MNHGLIFLEPIGAEEGMTTKDRFRPGAWCISPIVEGAKKRPKAIYVRCTLSQGVEDG
jgi:hypothetical protein